MIDSILQRLAAGESVDPSSPELAAAFADAAFRRDFVDRAIDFFELRERLDPELDVVGQAAASEASIAEFVQGLGFFVGMRESFEQGLAPSEGAVASEYDPRPALDDIDDATLDAALEVLSRSFFFEHRWGDEQRIEGDLFVLPNFELATARPHWTSAATASGAVAVEPVDDADAGPFAGRIDSDGSSRSELKLAVEPDEDLVTATGTCAIAVASRLRRFPFTPGDVGEKRSDGDVAVTLETLQNDCARVTIEGADTDLPRVVIGRDATGARLRERESQSQHGHRTWTGDVRFAGTLASVEVVVAAATLERRIDISASAAPEPAADGCWPSPAAPRYLPPPPEPTFAALTPADLGTLELTAGRMTSSFEFNQSELHVHLPRCDNSALARIDLDEASAVDAAGDVVSAQPYGCGSSRALACHRFSFEGAERPESVARMRGEVTVRYPLRLARVTLTAGAPSPCGLRADFDGPRVTLQLEPPDSDSPFDLGWLLSEGELTLLHALDQTGRPLRRLPRRTWSNDSAELLFWGAPSTVQAWLVTEWDTVRTAFDVDAAPPLDESLRDAGRAPPACRDHRDDA
ncbi:MAG: hypothetical protein IPM29_21630 [Planctomycetes bacterium]|nr:hypothetical protein [Planctomycetota bacterium]